VLDLTGSAVDLGIVVGARSLANLQLVLFGGLLADRLPRSFILQGTEIAAALTQAPSHSASFVDSPRCHC
jgi:hypothetical protein